MALTATASPAERELSDRIDRLRKAVKARYLELADAVADSDAERALLGEGARLKATLAAVEAELDALRQPAGAEPAAETHDSIAVLGTLKDALMALMRHDGKVPHQLVAALDLVLADLTITDDEDSWRCQAYWHVPLTTGVARLGPVEFNVHKRQQRGAAPIRRNLGNSAVTAESTNRDTGILIELGLTAQAALVALNSPFHWFLPALVHALGGQPLPDDAPPEWRAQPFLAWLARIYAEPAFTWAYHFTTLQFTKQSLVNAVADLGGSADLRLICSHVPRTKIGAVRAMVKSPVKMWNGTQEAAPFLRAPADQSRIAGWKTDDEYSLFECACGASIDLVVRAPELPRRLLCRCGRMPDGDRWSMDPALRFPADYVALSPTVEQIATYQNRDLGRHSLLHVGEVGLQILKLPGLQFPQEMSTKQVAEATSRPQRTAWKVLEHLASQDLVTGRKVLDLRGKPMMWTMHGDPLKDRDHISWDKRKVRSDRK